MTDCRYCNGSGKMAVTTNMQSLRGSPIFSHNTPCPFCDATGQAPDPVLQSHRDGDADGLGGCRAVIVSLSFAALICVVVWLLTGFSHPLISE